jgi:hypothetical protein
MKDLKEFSKEEFDDFRGIVFEAFLMKWKNTEEINDDLLFNFFNRLPEEARYIGEQWGLNDTVFRDQACEYIIDNLIN